MSRTRKYTRTATKRDSAPRMVATFAALIVAMIADPARAAAPTRVATDQSCVTAKCHAAVAGRKHLHWPDLAQSCRTCHAQKSSRHAFAPVRSPVNCLQCHEDVTESMKTRKVLHGAISNKCLECHDPHGSRTDGLIAAASEKALCLRCHKKDEVLGERYAHGPTEEGACSMCHEPHAATNQKMLVKKGRTLCFDCHEDFAAAWNAAEQHHDDPDCIDCHNPHSGPQPKMLFAQGRHLCAECHAKQVKIAERAPVDHEPTTNGKECLNCHTPHASNSEPNLIAPQVDLCLDCHDRTMKSGKSNIMNMKAWLVTHSNWHRPIKEQFCTGCHRPHGSKYFRLLKKPFPPTFYSGFEAKKYSLCFSCHEPALVTTAKTRALTKFRDGDENLHFLHVNRKERGRTCRACHEVHASTAPFHIRKSVPYGKWMMPIGYRETENGGTCDPGCHVTKTYDRNKR